MANTPPRIVAGGQILPFRFLSPDSSADHQGLQATANGEIFGVSGEGTKYAPLSDLVTTNPHAEAGDPVDLRGDGEEGMVEAGAAFSAGVRLKADAIGRAVAVATTGTIAQNYGGRSQQAATAAGELVRISVETGTVRPAIV